MGISERVGFGVAAIPEQMVFADERRHSSDQWLDVTNSFVHERLPGLHCNYADDHRQRKTVHDWDARRCAARLFDRVARSARREPHLRSHAGARIPGRFHSRPTLARPLFAPMIPPGLATLNEPQAPPIEKPRISHIRLAEGEATEPGYLNVTSAPIALPDDSVESISGDQFIEHVTIQSAEALIAECKRVLKPGSTLRLTSLDLRVHVLNYIEQLGLRLDPAETLNAALRQVTYMYDEVDLVFRLKQAGFSKVVMRARTTGNTFIVEATK